MTTLGLVLTSDDVATRANAAALKASARLRLEREAIHQQIWDAQKQVRDLSREITRIERAAFDAVVKG